MAKNELSPEKQQKAYDRVKNFRIEITELRTEFDRLKRDREEQHLSVNRTELLGRRPHHTATPENPYANNPQSSSSNPLFANRNPNGAGGSGGLGFGSDPSDANRETHALREQSFMSTTNAQLDDFLDRGRAVLSDLGQQREILKGTQKRLYSVANTLGVSRDTIRMVERRAKQDKWIFAIGCVVFFGFCWLVMHYLR
jgi:golgi SNAP receptor complex member 2